MLIIIIYFYHNIIIHQRHVFKADDVYVTNAHISFNAEQDNPVSMHHEQKLGSAHYTSPPLSPLHKSAWDSGALLLNTVTLHCVGSKFMRQLTDWQQLNIAEYLWVQRRISTLVSDNEQWCWCCVKTLSGRNVTDIKVISFYEIKKASHVKGGGLPLTSMELFIQ